MALLAVGCLPGERALPPEEALDRAAAGIETLVQRDEALRESGAVSPQRDGSTRNGGAVSVWTYAHPLISPLAGGSEAVTAFNARHDGFALRVRSLGDWRAAVQKLTVGLASGALPDIAVVKRAWMAQLIDSGQLIRLDDLLEPDFLDALYTTAKAHYTRNGRLYGLPADGFCSVLMYNRDKLPGKPPSDWSELRKVASELAHNNGHPIGHMPYIEALWSAGGCVWEDGGLRGAAAPEAMTFLLELRGAGLVHPRAMTNPAHGLALLQHGRTAMTVAPSYWTPRVQRSDINLGFAAVPGCCGPISRGHDAAIVVFAHSQAGESAIREVLEFLTGPVVQGAKAVELGSHPVRRDVAETIAIPEGLRAAYANVRSVPLTPSLSAIEHELDRRLRQAYRWGG